MSERLTGWLDGYPVVFPFPAHSAGLTAFAITPSFLWRPRGVTLSSHVLALLQQAPTEHTPSSHSCSKYRLSTVSGPSFCFLCPEASA